MLGPAPAPAASAPEAGQYATGLVPIDPATYVKLPSVKRHRGFYKQTVDLSGRFPPPGDQGMQSSCVAWATAYAARSFLKAAETGQRVDNLAEAASPQYVYSRVRGDQPNCSQGIQFVAALDLLRDEGVVLSSDYPYLGVNCVKAPPAALRGKAGALRIGSWRAIQRKVPLDWRTPIVLDDVKAQLSRGLPVVFAMQVSPAFRAVKTEVFKADAPAGEWHAMALVGYDEPRQAFRIMNSWGPRWGDGGFAWIDYETFGRLAGEAYVMEPVGQVNLTPTPVVQPAADPSAAIGELLRNADCARLSMSLEGGRRVVTGFAGVSDNIALTRAAVMALDPALEWRAASRPFPQCEAELTLANTLERSRVRLSIAGAAGQPIGTGDQVNMVEDDLFSFAAETTADRPYLHLIYIQSDGSAVELYRGAPAPDGSGRRRITLGAGGDKATRFQVAEPFGDETLIAVASSAPLFGQDLQTEVTEREFLTLLRASLVKAGQRRQPVEAAMVRIHTAKKPVTARGRAVHQGG